MVLEKGAALISAARSQRAAFVEEVLSGLSEISGQTRRVAERFGLVGVAGELATAAGITGWTPGESIWAAGVCFRAWIDGRGGPGDAEEVAVVGQVRHFFEMHSESRFTQWDRVGDDHAPRTSNRAGFVRMDGLDQPTYYVLPEVFRREIVAGFDHRWAALVLAKVGLLQLGADGRASRKERLPGFHNPVRCYVFPDGGKA
jgi:putative DNA primase/helicase